MIPIVVTQDAAKKWLKNDVARSGGGHVLWRDLDLTRLLFEVSLPVEKTS
jgi:hypothetical protein